MLVTDLFAGRYLWSIDDGQSAMTCELCDLSGSMVEYMVAPQHTYAQCLKIVVTLDLQESQLAKEVSDTDVFLQVQKTEM